MTFQPAADQTSALIDEFKRHVAINPATFDTGSVQLGSYRHKCAGRKDRPAAVAPTKNIDLAEVYKESPDGSVAMIYREGRCKGCGATARQSRPLFVDPQSRPPLEGRVGRS